MRRLALVHQYLLYFACIYFDDQKKERKNRLHRCRRLFIVTGFPRYSSYYTSCDNGEEKKDSQRQMCARWNSTSVWLLCGIIVILNREWLSQLNGNLILDLDSCQQNQEIYSSFFPLWKTQRNKLYQLSHQRWLGFGFLSFSTVHSHLLSFSLFKTPQTLGRACYGKN
jgi:hypothetical protein